MSKQDEKGGGENEGSGGLESCLQKEFMIHVKRAGNIDYFTVLRPNRYMSSMRFVVDWNVLATIHGTK